LETKKRSIFLNFKYYNYLIIIFILIISYSCSSTSGNESDNTQSKAVLLSPGELKAKINEQSSKLTALDCEGEISIDSPELNSSGSFTISIFKPDSIYSKLEGPFGISIADFLITRSNFIYYNIRENTVIKGSSSPLNLGAILRLKINFDDLMDGYSGSFHFADTTSVNSEVGYDKNLYLLKITEQDNTKKFWVNPKFFYIEQYEIIDNAGKTKLKIEYSEFCLEKNIFFPNSIYITNPNEKQNLWLSFSKNVFNNNRLKFKLKYPKSAKIVTWE
jgi:outer membrane lipoprotein-sorting protein